MARRGRRADDQLDFRLALRPEEDLRSEREKIAKKAYATLSGWVM